MKTVITIENDPIGGSKVTVQVDDGAIVPTDKALQGMLDLATNMKMDAVRAGVSSDPPVSQSVATKSRVRGKAAEKPKDTDTKKVVERQCVVCGDDISTLDKRRKLCLKPECQKEWNRRYAREWGRKHYTATKSPQQKKSTPATRQEPAPLPVTPQFMPGHEKTPEEIEAWRPKPLNLPESMPSLVSKASGPTSDFTDPWNCEACRRREHLCPLHQSMSDDGSVPPARSKGRPPQQ